MIKRNHEQTQNTKPQKPTHSETAALEVSLIIETRKLHQKQLEEEKTSYDLLGGFLEHYKNTLSESPMIDHKLADAGLPPLGKLFLNKLAAEQETQQLTPESVTKLTQVQINTAWNSLITELLIVNRQFESANFDLTQEWLTKSNNRLDFEGDMSTSSKGLLFLWLRAHKETRTTNPDLASTPPEIYMIQSDLNQQQKQRESTETEQIENTTIEKITASEEAEEDLTRALGENWQETLAEILPPEIMTTINTIVFTREVTGIIENILAGQEEIEAGGIYVHESKQIKIATRRELSPKILFLILMHEIAHAIEMQTDDKKVLQIKKTFYEAIRKAANQTSMYAARTYAHDSFMIGAGEDFAESLSAAFITPETLKQKNPERYHAIKEILKKIYPSVDIEETIEKIKNLDKERTKILHQNKEKIIKTINELPVPNEAFSYLLSLFPSLNIRLFDHLNQTATPNQVEERSYGEGYKSKATRTFNKKGRLQSEAIQIGEIEATVFKNPKYDNQDRLISYTSDRGEIAIQYKKDSKTPSQATLTHSGRTILTMKYKKVGTTIEETTTSQTRELPDAKIIHRFNTKGELTRLEMTMQEDTIAWKNYERDNKARTTSKTFGTGKGKQILKSKIKYN